MTPEEAASWLPHTQNGRGGCWPDCVRCRHIAEAKAFIAEEREACAKIVEGGYVGNRIETDCGDEIRKKAAAIRART